ncbi:MAG TPA: aminotransferase class V-fold PLP-dependent enzyme [Gemmatimonadaceae bacterium]|nr:aminotransferase class V-fold PLP-dependent enzyme [Gemmatimonadaceae bacterium]
MLTDDQIAELRSHFPILQEKTYLYNCSQGALSDASEGGLKAYADSWRTSLTPWEEWVGCYEALRAEFARFINAEPDEVAITTSVSAAINPIANAIAFNGRDKVVMSEFEFPTMGQIWLAQEPRGAKIQFLDGTNNEVSVDSYARAVDQKTRIVPLTQVSFVNGSRSDVDAVTKIAHDNGALLFLDGYQDCGTRPIDVKKANVDFYVAGTLKYLLGPPGVAFLYVKRELIEQLNPPITSWFAQQNAFAFETKHLEPAHNARRFEGGSPPMPSVYIVRPALALLQRIGLNNVAAQIEKLTKAFMKGLRDIGVATKTPASSVGPLVVVRAKDSQTMVGKLTARNVAVSARKDGVRFGFHVYNTLDDVNTALTVLSDNKDLLVRV